MKINKSEIITSAAKLSQFPDAKGLEVVLIGKSNVGKSSFINNLLARRSLARTSSTPGKTRTANFYNINDEFYIVDMPGYGYAKVSKTERALFDKVVKDYLKKRDADFLVFFLVDFRHKPTKNDMAMYEEILRNDIEPIIILTKTDKVKKSERAKNLKMMKEVFELDADDLVINYSVKDKTGRSEVLSFIEKFI